VSEGTSTGEPAAVEPSPRPVVDERPASKAFNGGDTVGTPSALALQLQGVGLFLFIPIVLYLLVAHPEPIAVSLPAAIALMLGHRFLARPYMRRARLAKCLWCNRALPGGQEPVPTTLPVAAGGETVAAAVCAHHRDPAARYLAVLDRLALPLRLGIFAPLLLLVVALAAAAAGRTGPPTLVATVALFQLVVGVTVNVAALGYPLAPAVPPTRLPFPAHNFFLLGIRNLLWVFRLVGVWWIVRGAWVLLG
jgi:hypothetical protein